MKRGQTGLIVILGVFLIILLAVLILSGVSARDGFIDSRFFQNCREIQIPYQVIEYSTSFLSAEITSKDSINRVSFDKDAIAISKVRLRNTDNLGGWFAVIFNWEILDENFKTVDRNYIFPGSTFDFESEIDTAGEDWKVSHSFISDPIDEPKLVTRYRTETRCD